MPEKLVEIVAPPPVKSGWRTTEFWGKNTIQIVMAIVMILNGMGLFDSTITPDQLESIRTGLEGAKEGLASGSINLIAMSIMGLVEVAYAVSRGAAKKAAANTS